MRSFASAVVLSSLLACAGGSPPPPPPPKSVVEVPVAPSRPAVSTPPPAPDPSALSLTASASGEFAGASGNVPGDSGITGIWANRGHVFVVGSGFVMRSTDRGLHFTKAPLDLRFPTVWSTGDDVFIGGEGTLVHSADGGASFVEARAVGLTGVGAPGRGAIQGIWGRSANAVYAVGGGGKPFVLKSIDRGATWTNLPTPLADGWLSGITTTDGADLVVTGEEKSTGKSSAAILRSTNDGKSWTRLPLYGERRDGGESRAACFASGVLFVSSVYTLHATRDLGKTWTQVAKLDGEVLALACRGKDVIVGGRGRSLAVSRDLGATWTKDPVQSLFASKELVSVQAAAIADTGEAYLGYEGLWDDRHGSLFRRSP